MVQAEYVTTSIRTPITGASPTPSTNSVLMAYAQFIADLAGHPPRSIPLDTRALDLECRVQHLKKVLTARSTYLTAIVDDTEQNVPGGLDLRQVDAFLSDLTAEMAGTIQHAGGSMAERLA